ncbi:uncharacterized protein DDB_G0286299-like [Penaeus indicus]|uniref:uncharacterized protein DDB_G0286299-like n=1 Tax=Penaeus indicus TaxID=29960 RepID=UPI00300D98CA
MVHIVFEEEIGVTNEPKNKGWKKKPLQFVEPKEFKKKSAIGKKSFNYKENSMMTKCDGMWVKKEFVEEYDKLKSSLEGQLLEPKEKKMKLLKARRKAHKQLRMELFKKAEKKPKKLKDVQKTSNSQTNKNPQGKTKQGKKSKSQAEEKDPSEPKPKKDKKNKAEFTTDKELSSPEEQIEGEKAETDNKENSKTPKKEKGKTKKSKIEKKEKSSGKITAPKDSFMSFKFEESDIMTQFEGVWVKNAAIEELESVKRKNLESIFASRTNGNKSEDLSKSEKIIFHKSMQKKLKVEHRRLKNELKKQV